MIGGIVKKLFGSSNERELKRITEKYVGQVNALEPEIEKLSHGELKGKTAEFKQKLDNGASLNDILPEAFAVVRETGKRVLNMRHFDVQIIGGVALHEGRIAEMKTGEGKTLVATLPVYLNALTGKGVHVVTVNDYLAQRDSEWMGQIYDFLGMSVGVIQHGISEEERKEAYDADIAYATNNELGFDYLRDNMKFNAKELAQKELNFAIVDEVDSILVDEARTPLIISGPAEASTDQYYKINRMIPKLLKKDKFYTVEEKSKATMLTEEGVAEAENALGVDNLYDPLNIDILHHVQQGLKAHVMFKKDVDYMIKDGKVVIVDEFTGRLMEGRRWSDGLHQAVEAKEAVKIENENQTLATITFQNFFRMYNKLSGMTGTADTEAAEFADIYNLEVLVIPPNKPLGRVDRPDQIYMSVREKDNAIIEEIIERNENGQPVLVGTISIEKSEKLSSMLKKRRVDHNVLNAKHHEKEAEIVAQAGRSHAVTIATNMAGRGTDIVLGGNPEMLAKARIPDTDDEGYDELFDEYKEASAVEHEEVIEAGGLHIIGTERHESRRIDNQLRGRSGRQGDPGSSRFFLSLEDDLMRIFGSDKLQSLMDRLGLEEGEAIEHKMVTRAIEGAQKKVEGHNFDIRKHLLEYDDVMNRQREIIYDQRKMIFAGEELEETIVDMSMQVLEDVVADNISEDVTPEDWDLEGLKDAMERFFGITVTLDEKKNISFGDQKLDFETVTFDPLFDALTNVVNAKLATQKKQVDDRAWIEFEKYITLNIVDSNWKDHLLTMDHLKEGIGLRGMAGKNPLNEYKKEGMGLFNAMSERIREDTVANLFHMQIRSEEEARLQEREERRRQEETNRMVASHGETEKPKTVVRTEKKVGRNDPCPCGSGKKYKKCHGKAA